MKTQCLLLNSMHLLLMSIADYQGNSLREELHKIKAESKPEEVKKDLIKKSLKAFIRKCLHMRIDACTILDVLEKLQSNLLSVDVYEWCKGELENSNKPDSPSPPEKCVQHPIVSEVNFCKEVVQNSLVTCHLLEQEDMSIKLCGCENSLIEGNKSIGLRPDIAKPTQHEGPVHRYLVASAKGATNSVIYYIAFSSHQSLREWSDSYESLQEGIYVCVHVHLTSWQQESTIHRCRKGGGIVAYRYMPN